MHSFAVFSWHISLTLAPYVLKVTLQKVEDLVKVAMGQGQHSLEKVQILPYV